MRKLLEDIEKGAAMGFDNPNNAADDNDLL